ncbi:hypothetical protein [Caulobacter sp.]|uniref:hypothetical protein n=1 Tax=Caulobacter sp. TaxID=78 RepID=UPI002B49868A|nr:hypothetical protein [Caulobacter sp.]HJV41344.1 hypothetical protein [Caulobacter sp.]
MALFLLSAAPVHAADGAPEPRRTFGDTTLTDGADSVTNDKTVDLADSVDFGGGEDTLVNNGTITIGAGAAAPVDVSLLSLDALKNTGLIDLRNGHAGDVLRVSGDYGGSGAKALLGLDVGPDGGADRLVVGEIANGRTGVVLGGLTAKTAKLTGDKGPVLIEAGKDSTANAFFVENAEIGFVRYELEFDSATTRYRLKGVAGQRAYEMLKVSEGAGGVWRQSADAWSAHVANLRDADGDANGLGVWGQAFGGRTDRDDKVGASAQAVEVDYRQTTYGGQFGADLINAGLDDGRLLLGLTGGYADSEMRFSGVAGQEAKLRVANVGGYMALTHGGYFVNALAKVDHQSIKVRNGPDAIDLDFDGTSYGAQVEAGGRSEADGLIYEKLLAVSYVSTRLDDTAVFAQRLDFDNASGFVAKAGVRGVLNSQALGGVFGTYGAAFVVHDFTVKNGLDLIGGDQVEHLSKDGGRTFGQVTVGLSYRVAAASTFLEATGENGGGRAGGTLRLGARIGF